MTYALFVSPENAQSEVAFCRDHIHEIGVDYVLPDPERLDIELTAAPFEECRLHAVLFQYDPDQYALILKNKVGRRILVVPTGYIEAWSIHHYAKMAPHSSP